MEKYSAEESMPPRARRVSSPDVLLKRAALQAVSAASGSISGWQSTAVRLRAKYLLETDAEARAAIAAQAHSLLLEVTKASRQLAEDAQSLPANVTHNGRFQDVVRALDSIVAALEAFASPASS